MVRQMSRRLLTGGVGLRSNPDVLVCDIILGPSRPALPRRQDMANERQTTTLSSLVVVKPTSSEWHSRAPIMPERFGSTSGPQSNPIVTGGLNSTSSPVSPYIPAA